MIMWPLTYYIKKLGNENLGFEFKKGKTKHWFNKVFPVTEYTISAYLLSGKITLQYSNINHSNNFDLSLKKPKFTFIKKSPKIWNNESKKWETNYSLWFINLTKQEIVKGYPSTKYKLETSYKLRLWQK